MYVVICIHIVIIIHATFYNINQQVQIESDVDRVIDFKKYISDDVNDEARSVATNNNKNTAIIVIINLSFIILYIFFNFGIVVL